MAHQHHELHTLFIVLKSLFWVVTGIIVGLMVYGHEFGSENALTTLNYLIPGYLLLAGIMCSYLYSECVPQSNLTILYLIGIVLGITFVVLYILIQ